MACNHRLALGGTNLPAQFDQRSVDACGPSAPVRKCLSHKMKAVFSTSTSTSAQLTKTLRDRRVLTYTRHSGIIHALPNVFPHSVALHKPH